MFRILHITNEIFFLDPYRLIRIFGLENFTSVFCKTGGNLNFEKNVEFLEFLGFTLCFRTFQAKNFFSKFSRLIEKFWPVINSCCLFWTWKFYKCFSKIGGKFKFFQKCWISWVFWFYFMFQDISSKKIQTDRKILKSADFRLMAESRQKAVWKLTAEKPAFCKR